MLKVDRPRFLLLWDLWLFSFQPISAQNVAFHPSCPEKSLTILKQKKLVAGNEQQLQQRRQRRRQRRQRRYLAHFLLNRVEMSRFRWHQTKNHFGAASLKGWTSKRDPGLEKAGLWTKLSFDDRSSFFESQNLFEPTPPPNPEPGLSLAGSCYDSNQLSRSSAHDCTCLHVWTPSSAVF